METDISWIDCQIEDNFDLPYPTMDSRDLGDDED